MWDLLRTANDDQFALLGCAAVLLGSGLLMYLSYFLGPVARQERIDELNSLIRQRQQLLQDTARTSVREAA